MGELGLASGFEMQRLLLLSFLLAACSAATAPAPQPVTRIPEAPLAAPDPVASAPEPAPPPDHGFAPSPLTGIANQLVDLACAVVERRPLPTAPLPISPEPPPGSPESLLDVGSRGTLASCHGLEFFLFMTEVTVKPAPSSAGAPAPASGVELMLLLTKAGLKIGRMTGGSKGPYPPERGMLDIAATGREIADAICADRGSTLVVGEPERALLANDKLYERMERFRPTESSFLEVKQGLGCGREPVYGVDDFEIVARDASGEIYNFVIGVDDQNGVPYLKGSPLLRIRKIGRPSE
jgi:hypothetical protein